MVDSVDKESYELAEVNVCEPGSLKELRSSVDEVCSENLIDLFFSQLFVRPPQAAILLFCISFPWGWS